MLIAVWIVASGGARQPEPVNPDSVYDPIVAGEDFPGGVRWIISRDGIRPVYDPEFVTASEVDWDTEALVIGLEIDGEARAYPIGFLSGREMVNDTVAGVPVLVSWCPLCATATVHRREIDGREVLFGNQGALWGNAMTWWDHDTGSIWSQPLGEAIAGPHEGRRLELLPSTLTTWAAWRAAHPDTDALGVRWQPSSFDLVDMVVVVELAGEAAAYPIAELRETGVVNDVVGGVPIAVVVDPADADRWAVFSRELDDGVITLSIRGGAVVDDTRSTWDVVSGRGQSGEHLARLPANTAFPDDFSTFWPDGRVWTAS